MGDEPVSVRVRPPAPLLFDTMYQTFFIKIGGLYFEFFKKDRFCLEIGSVGLVIVDKTVVLSKPTKKAPEFDGVWEEHPQGISADYKAEFMCQSTYSEEEGWSQWAGPFLWSSWGEDGMDGDGIEYLFAITNNNTDAEKEELKNKLPKSKDFPDKWQEPEIWDIIRKSGIEYVYFPWTDDPKDVGPNEPYEWVSIRRRKWDKSLSKGVYGEFSDPIFWAKWTKDPIIVDLSNEMDSVTTGSDYVLNLDGGSINLSTDVRAFINDDKYEIKELTYNFEDEVDSTNITVNISSIEDGKWKRMNVILHNGLDFAANEKHNIVIKMAIKIKDPYSETLIERDAVYKISPIRDGKDGAEGKVLRIVPSSSQIIYDPNSKQYTDGGELSANVYLGDDIYSEAIMKYKIGTGNFPPVPLRGFCNIFLFGYVTTNS